MYLKCALFLEHMNQYLNTDILYKDISDTEKNTTLSIP